MDKAVMQEHLKVIEYFENKRCLTHEEQIRWVEEIVNYTKKVCEEYPDDFALKIGLESMEQHLKELRKQY